jgi:hypothetical protein
MNRWCFLMIPVFLPVIITGQVQLSGYFESEYDLLSVTNEQYSFGYNKLRVDLENTITDEIAFAANVNIQRYSGQTTWNLFDFIPRSVWSTAFDPNTLALFTADFPITLEDTLYLDNAFVKLHFPTVDLSVGKQQISLGTGYAWNPLDIFNAKLLLDPTYEQTGVNAIRLEWPFGERGGLDVIVSPGEDWSDTKKLVQVKGGIGRFDIIGTVGSFKWERSVIDAAELRMIETSAERFLIGGAVVGELAGFGVWMEGGYNELAEEEDFAEFLIGSDYTFENGFYFLIEYYHNGHAPAETDEIRFDHYLQVIAGEIHSLMQDYSFCTWMYPLSDFVSIGMLNIGNISDGSYLLGPQCEWNVFQDVNVSLLLGITGGSEETEFGLQDWSGRLRIRAYF